MVASDTIYEPEPGVWVKIVRATSDPYSREIRYRLQRCTQAGEPVPEGCAEGQTPEEIAKAVLAELLAEGTIEDSGERNEEGDIMYNVLTPQTRVQRREAAILATLMRTMGAEP
jgi:hypothetical protein